MSRTAHKVREHILKLVNLDTGEVTCSLWLVLVAPEVLIMENLVRCILIKILIPELLHLRICLAVISKELVPSRLSLGTLLGLLLVISVNLVRYIERLL